MTWRADAEQGNEAVKVMWDIVPYTRGHVLDLGCSIVSPYEHFIGVDKAARHPGSRARWIQADCAKPMPMFGDNSWDSVFSSHLLEHIHYYKDALKEWWRIVRVGGYLVLYLPHRDHYPRMGSEFANKDHKHDFAPDDILAVMWGLGGFDLVENQTRTEGDEYSFLMVFRKRADAKVMDFTQNRPPKTAAVFRCGGFGDMIQASSVIRALHDEGYAVTLYTAPRGYAIIKHDPYIARIFIQDDDQVPNGRLGEYWAHIAKQYDKFVNLSGTVEDAMLALPNSANHRLPHAARHMFMNVNYMEYQHAVAGVDAEIRPMFYPSQLETGWAQLHRQSVAGQMILWSLTGSAVHKVWPKYLEAITGILDEHEDATVYLIGGEDAYELAAQCPKNERIVNLCGKANIRESMALCMVADLVVGPETGILNAAGHMDVPKVVLLSHSSKENLTKHWKNAIALEPQNTPCYPCHRMHYGFEHCHEVKPDAQVIQWAKRNGITPTGTALCMENISVQAVMGAIDYFIGVKELAKAIA